MSSSSPVRFTNKNDKWVGNEVILVSDITGEPLPTDEITGSLITIDSVHNEVHEGETFRAWYVVPHASPIADNAFVDIVITTGAKEVHIVFGFGLGGDAEFNLYRTPNFEADGTPLVPHNLKDASSNVALSTISIDPTINNVGTEIDGEFLPGGSGGNAQGGAIRSGTEDILKINTFYLVRLTNRAGNAKQFSVEMQWYEEPPA